MKNGIITAIVVCIGAVAFAQTPTKPTYKTPEKISHPKKINKKIAPKRMATLKTNWQPAAN